MCTIPRILACLRCCGVGVNLVEGAGNSLSVFVMVPRSKPRPIWSASAAQAADGPRLARTWQVARGVIWR